MARQGNRNSRVQIFIPEMNPEFLERLADFLEADPAEVPPHDITRLRERANALRLATPLTATSRVEDLDYHGVTPQAIAALKSAGIHTIGELCDRCAHDLEDVPRIGPAVLTSVSMALAKFHMGLRPNRA